MKGVSHGDDGWKLVFLTMMLIISASSFTLQESASLPVVSRSYIRSETTCVHRYSRELGILQAVKAPPEEVGGMPHLQKNGVYSVTNEAQHKALMEANPDKLMVLKVFAPWCRTCKGLTHKFTALVKKEKYKGLPIIFADISSQHNHEYIKSIGVRALPTIQFYIRGERADSFVCGPSKVPMLKRKLAEWVSENVDPTTKRLKPPPGEESIVEVVQTVADGIKISAEVGAEVGDMVVHEKRRVELTITFKDQNLPGLLETRLKEIQSQYPLSQRSNLKYRITGRIQLQEGGPSICQLTLSIVTA